MIKMIKVYFRTKKYIYYNYDENTRTFQPLTINKVLHVGSRIIPENKTNKLSWVFSLVKFA